MNAVRRHGWIALLVALSAYSHASTGVRRVLLVPLDDRPATTQFAQMIGDLADVRVDTPPGPLLGHFLQPGKPDSINSWLSKNLADYDVLVVNADMIAYGGLIASRTDRSSYNLALGRIRDFAAIRRQYPNLKVYCFSSVMRLAPTATKQSAAWRAQLARLVELGEKQKLAPDPKVAASIKNLQKVVPPAEVARYYAVRDRDHRIQQELLRMAGQGVFDYLAFGQDDAKPVGPHVPETKRLKAMSQNLKLGGKTLFAAGIDQLANVLLSRSLMASSDWNPKIRVVYADEAGRQKVAFYESDTIDNSLRDQILGSGASFAKPGESFDYSLYVNTPDPRSFALDAFLKSMASEVDQGFPVAVADVNLGSSGTADPRLFGTLTAEGRSSHVLAYAGWNTAGNTMGTTIPAANVYMLARRNGVDPLRREVALRAFILHRLVNDFEYHKYVRPEAYAMIDKLPSASREETYGTELQKVDNLVKTDLGDRLQKLFDEQLRGTKFFAGSDRYEVVGLKDIDIGLPWPRAYEVKVSFHIEVAQATQGQEIDFSQFPILPLGPTGKNGG
ncbi:MAG: DUF4127 family protein [Armatimonadetes bacterium]|nr:DUF4127 family protein [Armatimonadota bacterium]